MAENNTGEPNSEQGALEKLYRDVSLTRRNRINASNRLLKKEEFVQNINIYYSCLASVVTVLSLIYTGRSFGVASAILTVILAISIVYLNAQKYGDRAQQLKTNYIALQQLAFEIKEEQRKNQIASIKKFSDRYIELLQTSENHIHQDHLQTLHLQDVVEKKKMKEQKDSENRVHLSGKEKFEYWFYEIRYAVIKVLFWIAPVVYFIFELFINHP